MAKITDRLPNEVNIKYQNLVVDLTAKIPAKRLDQNLLIATWNIRGFGDLTRTWENTEETPKRNLADVRYISEILSRFDVIAVQEVKANIRALRDTLKLLGNDWGLVLTDVTKGDAGNGERMAYLFDKRRVSMSGLACELVVPKEQLDNNIGIDALSSQFVRTPYAVSFRTSTKTFILVTLHVDYGDSSRGRIPELKAIANWMKEWATDINAYDHNLIVLGDFNIEKRGGVLDKTFLSEGLHVPPDLQNPAVLRSIFPTKKDKYYDQIAWFQDAANIPSLSMNFMQGGNYDFVPLLWDSAVNSRTRFTWKMSDHYPLWVEFDVMD